MAHDIVPTTKVLSDKHPGGFYEVNTSDYDKAVHGKAATDADLAKLVEDAAKAKADADAEAAK